MNPLDARWVWGLGLGGAVLALLLFVVLGPWESVGPPPPEPLRLADIASGVPAPAPLTSPAAEASRVASPELLAREAAIRAAEKTVERRPRPPPLRRTDSGIAPKRIVRKPTGTSAGKGLANLQLVATYQGRSISAPVEVDGVWRGNTPLAVTLSAGSHEIRIDHRQTRVNGFVTQVDGGKSVQMEVELRPASEARGNKRASYAKAHHH